MKTLLAALLLPAAAFAALDMQVSPGSYENLNPGDSFAVTLRVSNTGTEEVISYDFFLRASTDHVFFLTSQTLHAPLDEALYSPIFPYAVGTGNADDLGAWTFGEGFGTGIFDAQTLTFSIAPDASPGAYTLSFLWPFPNPAGGPNLVYGDFIEYQMASPLHVNISVVPEPSTWLLLTAFLMLFALRKMNALVKIF